MSTFGSPLSYYGTGISTEEIRKLRFDINKALAHLDDIAEHESEVSTLQGNIAAIESDISNLEAVDITYATSLSTHQSAIDDLDSALSNLEAYVGSTGLTFSTVSAEAVAAYNLGVFNDAKIGDQSGFPNASTTVADNLTELAADISGLTSDLSNTDGIVSGHTSSIGTLTTDLDTLEAAAGNLAAIPYSNIVNSLLVIDTVASAAAALSSDIANTDANVAALVSDLSNTDANVANNASDITTLETYVGDIALIGSAANLSVAVGNISNLTVSSDLVSSVETLHSELGNTAALTVGSNVSDAINLLDSSISTLETTHDSEVGDIANLAIGGDLTEAIGILNGYFDDVFNYTQTYKITSTTISGVQTLSGWTKTDGGSGNNMNANGYVDIGKTGIYHFSFGVYFSADTADSPTDKQSLYIKNDTTSETIGFMTDFRTVDSDGGLVCCATAPVSSGDQIIFQAYTQDAATNTIGSAAFPILAAITFICP